MKRLIDLMLALIMGLFLVPVILLIAGLVLILDGAPVFYVAERMQAPGRPFHLWKFRTMTPDIADRGVSGGDKARRITRSGRILRKLRLDELPQIWNVIRGDISFVGPRPPLRVYVEDYPDLYAQVLQSTPGITGLATLVFHRHEEWLLSACTTVEETDRVYRQRCIPRKAQLDLIYQRNQSVCYDLLLIWRTFAKVFLR
ncbi:sugar transferase [Shimia biformata]|uniref:sugar transferase n=1 Tax=Shimia biformata TaxID=1294299 RepID=UPI001951E1CD|nr:sugar transferase [Shimia biformata]